jgi:hypothetical protein
MADGYLIGQNLREKLRVTIDRVDEMPYGKRPTKIETRFEDVPRSAGARLRLGKTTATWTKGTLATIPLWENGDAPNETASGTNLEDCVNKFATVQSNKWVGMLRGPGGKHYLIAAEC